MHNIYEIREINNIIIGNYSNSQRALEVISIVQLR